jgi:hypothetical protein
MLLALGKLPRMALQPLVDRAVDALPTWKGWLMHKSGRLVLVKTTMSAMPIYMAISISLPPWLPKALVKISMAFLWSGSDVVQGGKCVVACCRVACL